MQPKSSTVGLFYDVDIVSAVLEEIDNQNNNNGALQV